MAAPTKVQILSLYKQLLRESNKLSDYNFRMYALRRTKDAFKENKAETNVTKIQDLVAKAKENLDILKRQALISHLFGSNKLVIEKPATPTNI
ncbi:LYR motif-containing protein 4-like [Physella acuta]|uniref:LYR motif-containing protein 4-like n=1 Tax=Physella acuta TaxID=109671 RepID=UPI0027DD847C|nr:LYR motif-containing protein 4-like [Physella acuta]